MSGALAARRGVGPSSVVLPQTPDAAEATVLDFLSRRFAHISRSKWTQRMAEGSVCTAEGATLAPDAPYCAGMRIHYFRALASEAPIPLNETVLYRDAHILVADKPHFLPVIPSGKYLHETLLVRLKQRLALNDLVPIHRIDRDTAGLVLFSINPATRNAYHALFRERAVDKRYEAIAPWNPELAWPVTRRSRIGPAAHFMQQTETNGPANSWTEIAPLEVCGAWARYALRPHTGQRHQLRVHMAALGMPIAHDGIYPVLTPEAAPDFARPLQLLARSIAFTDPVSAQAQHFESPQRLKPLDDVAAEHAKAAHGFDKAMACAIVTSRM
jgi:tRNA pseudouridine32 synthase/23S rRNA pseudouridine746 synthase